MPGVVHLNANAVFARLVAVDAAAVVIASGESASCHVNHQSVEFGCWVAMIASALIGEVLQSPASSVSRNRRGWPRFFRTRDKPASSVPGLRGHQRPRPSG